MGSRRGNNELNIVDLEEINLTELREMARTAEIAGFSRMKKNDLILNLLRHKAEQLGFELRCEHKKGQN